MNMTRLFIVALILASGCASVPSSLNRYESASASEISRFKRVYLPFRPGTQFEVSQGAFGRSSHLDIGNEYSWDFDVPLGTEVTAVEAGKVIQVWAPEKGGGCDSRHSGFAHNIKVQHYDGTVAQYVHVQSRVKLNEVVSQGSVIAVTAENGWICQPHLHFGIYRSIGRLYDSKKRETLPLRFAEMAPDEIAREGLKAVVPPNNGKPLLEIYSGIE